MTRFRPPSDDPIPVRRGPQDPGPELRGCALITILTGVIGSVAIAMLLLAGIITGFVYAVAWIGAR